MRRWGLSWLKCWLGVYALAAPSLAFAGAGVTSKCCARDGYAQDSTRGEPFPLADVRLLDGPFKASQDVHARYLLSLEPDRLLARFRLEAGLEPKAKNYPGLGGQGASGRRRRFLSVRLLQAVCGHRRQASPRACEVHARRIGGLPEGQRRWIPAGHQERQAYLRRDCAGRHPVSERLAAQRRG